MHYFVNLRLKLMLSLIIQNKNIREINALVDLLPPIIIFFMISFIILIKSFFVMIIFCPNPIPSVFSSRINSEQCKISKPSKIFYLRRIPKSPYDNLFF